MVIARREFIERVRTKWFVIVTLLGPLLMVGVIVVPAVLASKEGHKKTKVALVSHGDAALTASVTAGLEATDPQLEIEPAPADSTEDQLLARIKHEEITGYLTLPADLLTGGKVVYAGANATNFEAIQRMEAGIQAAVVQARALADGLTPEQLEAIGKPVPFEATHTTGEKGGASGAASFILGYIVMFILYMSILLYAINVMRSVIQEKTSRVVEVVISSVKPSTLMAGKIAGVGSVGLLQVGIWAGMSALLMKYKAAVLGMFGVTGAGGFTLPSVGFGSLALVLAYFVLGFFFYASLYAAIGAMCSTEQEAQQAQTPVVMLLVIPVACVQLVANDPRSSTAAVLTTIPFSSPVLMPMRFLLGGATATDVAISLGVLALSIAVVVWVASRIYRVGILMYGKRPSFGELARWIRHR
jgi:ABC-2 type transport system permease protein